ncbi:hypothetical protein EDB86DRAFT_625024 [Lactarius hatsudake]|nr:hypothetical protein EDB86DRAFT_625024 [Lactarius hatsudake]
MDGSSVILSVVRSDSQTRIQSRNTYPFIPGKQWGSPLSLRLVVGWMSFQRYSSVCPSSCPRSIINHRRHRTVHFPYTAARMLNAGYSNTQSEISSRGSISCVAFPLLSTFRSFRYLVATMKVMEVTNNLGTEADQDVHSLRRELSTLKDDYADFQDKLDALSHSTSPGQKLATQTAELTSPFDTQAKQKRAAGLCCTLSSRARKILAAAGCSTYTCDGRARLPD